jgi:hypothetical protein
MAQYSIWYCATDDDPAQVLIALRFSRSVGPIHHWRDGKKRSKTFISLIFFSSIDPARDWTDWRILARAGLHIFFFPDHIHPSPKLNRHILIRSAHMVHTKGRVHTDGDLHFNRILETGCLTARNMRFPHSHHNVTDAMKTPRTMRIQLKLKSASATRSAFVKPIEGRSCVQQRQRSLGNSSIEREGLDEIGLLSPQDPEHVRTRAYRRGHTMISRPATERSFGYRGTGSLCPSRRASGYTHSAK